MLQNPLDDKVRSQLAMALADRRGADVTQALITLARHPDPRLRVLAASALADRPGSLVTDTLLNLMDDSEFDVVHHASWALKDRPGAETTIGLLNHAMRHHTTHLRGFATVMLANRTDSAITQWFSRLATEAPPGEDDLDFCYEVALLVASNSRAWPRAERQQLLEAIGRFTQLCTGRR